MTEQDDMKRVVEINGIKIEVDLRTAKRVDQYKVGDRVKVLIKGYNESYKSHPGVIVGFDEFKALPTIVVAYVESSSWSTSAIKMAYINSGSKDIEICAMTLDEALPSRDEVTEQFDRAIAAKQAELSSLVAQRSYFIDKFATIYTPAEGEKTA